jgi:NitT/TauT family transport system ATP-binding protein
VSSLEARGVSMTFETRRGSVHALDDVSLTIPDAHFTCLVGASGCGKSTLLNIMAGLIDPTAGEVLLDGRPIDGPSADRGMVFQSYTLYPWMTVRRNVEFGPKLKGVGRAERRELAAGLIDEMALAEFADSYPKELSGGMKQRVAIARAGERPAGAADGRAIRSARRADARRCAALPDGDLGASPPHHCVRDARHRGGGPAR